MFNEIPFVFLSISIEGNSSRAVEKFNRLRGEDHWIGRIVKKKFGAHGIFTGKVHDVDDHDGFEVHRIFQVVYTDGDDEWLPVDELVSILQPVQDEESTADTVRVK